MKWFSLCSDKDASSLIHCGSICKTENSCAGFTFKDKVCQLVSMAMLLDKSDDSSEKVYIDTTLEGNNGRSWFYEIILKCWPLIQ